MSSSASSSSKPLSLSHALKFILSISLSLDISCFAAIRTLVLSSAPRATNDISPSFSFLATCMGPSNVCPLTWTLSPLGTFSISCINAPIDASHGKPARPVSITSRATSDTPLTTPDTSNCEPSTRTDSVCPTMSETS